MDLLFELRQLMKFIVMPPGVFLLVGLIGLWLGRKSKSLHWLVWVSLAVMLLTSTGFGSNLAMRSVEAVHAPLSISQAKTLAVNSNLQAIVVLGGGLRLGAKDDSDLHAPSHFTLQRLAYAAQLHRATGLPLLVSGGLIAPASVSEAKAMADSLSEQFGISAKWLEDKSMTTQENAQISLPILKQAGVSRAFLVTAASHMPRSMREFSGQGVQFDPAPTDFTSDGPLVWRSFLPTARGADRFSMACNEWLGLLWVTMKACLTGKC